MKLCHRCGKENPDNQENCLRCGIKLNAPEAMQSEPVQEPENFCYRHKNEKTNLACGRCGRYICHKCVILGPAGPRCRECAKQDISIRPTAIIYDLKTRVIALLKAPYAFWVIIVAIGMIGGLVRSCNEALHPRPVPPSISIDEDEQPSPRSR